MIPRRELKFGRWLRAQRDRVLPVGDLARDFVASRCRARTAVGVRQSLDQYDACDGVYRALGRATQEYTTSILAGGHV
jgi:hypothetical protein